MCISSILLSLYVGSSPTLPDPEIERSLLYFTRAAFAHLFSQEAFPTVIPKRVFLNNDAVNMAKRTQNKYYAVCYHLCVGVFVVGWLDRLF